MCIPYVGFHKNVNKKKTNISLIFTTVRIDIFYLLCVKHERGTESNFFYVQKSKKRFFFGPRYSYEMEVNSTNISTFCGKPTYDKR